MELPKTHQSDSRSPLIDVYNTFINSIRGERFTSSDLQRRQAHQRAITAAGNFLDADNVASPDERAAVYTVARLEGMQDPQLVEDASRVLGVVTTTRYIKNLRRAV